MNSNRPAGLPSRKQVLDFIASSDQLAGKREIARAFGLPPGGQAAKGDGAADPGSRQRRQRLGGCRIESGMTMLLHEHVMAGGWTRDSAVQDQIEDTVKDAILRAHALTPKGESAEDCDDCGEPIPRKRREALPGVRTCVACQSERDKSVVHSTINRPGSKDSQLR